MSRTVADIMNAKLLYIGEGDPVSLARAQILKFGVTAVPVLDAAHRPIGIVSLRDFARDGEMPEPSTPVRTVRGDASLDAGARTLVESRLHHLVVVDEHGIAVGMVSALDFVAALVEQPVKHPASFERY